MKNGAVVKGRSFNRLKYAGNPVNLAAKYYMDGADELVFLDIMASNENRKTTLDLVEKVAERIFIPFSVGGGVSSISDIRNLLMSGADKVSINTSAVKNPKLITKASEIFGSQCIVVAIDAAMANSDWEVYINGGREKTGLNAIKWAKEAQSLGAGEIMLTSIDNDGKKENYDIKLTRLVSEAVNIPVIASGGAASPESIMDVLTKGKASAALAASIFHYGSYSISDVKRFLLENGIKARM